MCVRYFRCLALALALSLGSCREQTDAKPPARLAETLPVLPLPPNASMVSVDRGTDVTRIRMRSDLDPESLGKFYRGILSKEPWHLVGDSPMADGAIALYAERKGNPPLWVIIRKADGASGSFVDLAGAKIK